MTYNLLRGVLMRNHRPQNVYPVWLIMPSLALFTIFFIIPNLTSFLFAFTDWSLFYLKDFTYIGLDNFRMMFGERIFIRSVFNTFYFAVITVIFKNMIGLLLALIVDRDLKSKTYLRGVFFLPTIISQLIVAIVFIAILNPRTGIVNTFLRSMGLGFLAREWLVDARYAMNCVCLMDIWQGAGFHMLIYLAGLQTVQKDYQDCALIDGASYLQRLWYITIPLIMATFTVNITLSMISGLKVFGQVYALTNGGPADATQVISSVVYKTFSSGLLGYGSAWSFVFTLGVSVISLTFAIIIRRKEVEV
jgi:raffinose/stachyose/melibiose transport system permease protein